MSLSASSLASELYSALQPIWENPPDTEEVDDTDYGLKKWCDTVAEVVVNHITANAEATGTDSHGDSHDLNIV